MKKLLIAAVLVLSALPLQAAEEGATLSPFAGNLGNAIWTLGIFVIVIVVLGKFAWGPVLGLLQERESFIHKGVVRRQARSRRGGSAAEGIRGEAAKRAR
jgi:F0F1-type ATP synthase membrane subunit b/b'